MNYCELEKRLDPVPLPVMNYVFSLCHYFASWLSYSLMCQVMVYMYQVLRLVYHKDLFHALCYVIYAVKHSNNRYVTDYDTGKSI